MMEDSAFAVRDSSLGWRRDAFRHALLVRVGVVQEFVEFMRNWRINNGELMTYGIGVNRVSQGSHKNDPRSCR